MFGSCPNIIVKIDYSIAATKDNVATVVEAIRMVEKRAWTTFSKANENEWPDFDQLYSRSSAEQIYRDLLTKKSFGDGSTCSSVEVPVSPDSFYEVDITIWREDRLLSLNLHVDGDAETEVEGRRQLGEMMWDWYKRQNTSGMKCLSSIPQPGQMPDDELARWLDKYNSLLNTPSMWPQNRECFRCLVETLESLFPSDAWRWDGEMWLRPVAI